MKTRLLLVPAVFLALLLALAPSAAPAQEDPGFPQALAGFEKFAAWWVRELDAQRLDSKHAMRAAPAPEGGYAAAYTAIDPASMSLKVLPTNSPSTPYVGILSYTETTWKHTAPSEQTALDGPFDPTAIRRVTEIFTRSPEGWR